MCHLIKMIKTEDGTYTGYKVAVKTPTGNYYSPAMGVRYTLGKVRIPKRQKEMSGYFKEDILNRRSPLYRYTMVGKTMVFSKIADAIHMMSNFPKRPPNKNNKFVILRMKIGTTNINGELDEGVYNHERVVAGDLILSMFEIELDRERLYTDKYINELSKKYLTLE